MSSRIIAAPRWRHHKPVSVDITTSVPYYTSTFVDGSAVTTQNFRYNVVTTVVGSVITLPATIRADAAGGITVSVNGTVFPQSIGGYTPVIAYDAVAGTIEYFQGGTLASVPYQIPAGSSVQVDIVNAQASNLFKVISLPHEYLIQGARPLDTTLVDAGGFGVNQFQGGFMCFIELLTSSAHGQARVSGDKIHMEYRPDTGYSGTDSFAYRLTNVLGQQSDASCVTVHVGV